MKKFVFSFAVWSFIFTFVLAGSAGANSTIGANISTTGTLTVTSGGTSVVQFQNAAGTNLFIFDHTNLRLGVGAAPSTTLEVQGTASASYFISANAVQFASVAASVAYSRFGSTTTNHANYISAANDLLVSGDVEIRGSASFGSTASVSGIFFMNDGRFRPNANSVTAFRFQNTAGATNVLIIDTTNTRVGVNAGGAVDTTFEVGGTASATKADIGGTASASYFLSANAIQFASNAASVAYSRFGSTTTNHANYISAANDLLVSGDVEIRGSASFGSTASVSGIFFMNDGRFRPNANSVTAFRFQNTAGSTDVLTIDTTNTRVGVGNIGGALDTAFEVGGVASVATNLSVGMGSTATTSVVFETKATAKGICFVIRDVGGTVRYARLDGNTWTINTTDCR